MSRPSDLTEELTLQIREEVLNGLLYKNIQEKLEIPSNTWDAWVYKDYKDFRKNLNSWKTERILRKTEKLSEEILDMNHYSKDDRDIVNTDVLRVKQKEAEYVRSTLGKDEGYSTRTEQTGKDGVPLTVQFAPIFNKDANSSSETD